jgi:septal ring factor EnvC (AmiA/AmiB activator)
MNELDPDILTILRHSAEFAKIDRSNTRFTVFSQAADEIEDLRRKVSRLEALPAHLEREIERITSEQESTEFALRVVVDELSKARAELARLQAPSPAK